MSKRNPQQSGTYTCPDGGARKAALQSDGATPEAGGVRTIFLPVAEERLTGETAAVMAPVTLTKRAMARLARRQIVERTKTTVCTPQPLSNANRRTDDYSPGANIAGSCCGIDSRLCGDFNQAGCDALNNDDTLATQCQHQQQTAQGADWDRTQRGGSSGTAQQGTDYSNAVNAIQGTGVNGQPGSQPATSQPSGQPGAQPANSQPSGQPGAQPATSQPSAQPVTQPSNQGGTDIYGSDVCGYGGGPFRGCKTVGEMCAHIKTNGQPLPPECGGSGDNTAQPKDVQQPAATGQPAPQISQQPQPAGQLKSFKAVKPTQNKAETGDASGGDPTQQGNGQPATSQPANAQPATGQPATGQPANAQPAGGDPSKAAYYQLGPL
ncbi:uncharacterized protein KY384_001644 [Bacidia gigantensis]|uniref:uncharacterized protein n=1 Tax=Bacidia gigantensis TaxID=2732470 RepID=UPI001D04AE00|nr:uncharacterized protein KY384_001644 [Bacidia gigantensis]KAG8533903.1 hypothetical protein KY384_001644 [Bacidia gigantensis]